MTKRYGIEKLTHLSLVYRRCVLGTCYAIKLQSSIERYGGGHFSSPKDSPLRAKYFQWLHFPEGTISPYLSAIHRFEKLLPETVAVMKKELDIAIAFVDQALSNSQYIVGQEFTGADIMLTVSLLSTNMLGLLGDKHTNITAYLHRLQSRPVFKKILM